MVEFLLSGLVANVFCLVLDYLLLQLDDLILSLLDVPPDLLDVRDCLSVDTHGLYIALVGHQLLFQLGLPFARLVQLLLQQLDLVEDLQPDLQVTLVVMLYQSLQLVFVCLQSGYRLLEVVSLLCLLRNSLLQTHLLVFQTPHLDGLILQPCHYDVLLVKLETKVLDSLVVMLGCCLVEPLLIFKYSRLLGQSSLVH